MNTSKNNGVFFHLLSIMFITIFLACSTIDNNNDAVNLSNEHSKIKHTEIKEFQYAQFKKMKSNEIIVLPIEIPKREDYAIGLSDRDQVDNFGMLFNFGKETKYQGFSMQNTTFNLSIAFIDKNKIIVDIQEMQAYQKEVYISKYPFQYAIEAPAKWFYANDIQIGDTVAFP